MSDLAPETREEAYLYALATDGTVSLTPRTRKEALLKCAIEGRLPDFEPHTRKEAFLHALCMRNASGGTGGGGNTEKVVVLKETTLTFLPHPTLGAYMATNVPLFQLEEGKSYTAVWAGTEYVCVAKTESFSGMTAVAIGNKAMLGIGENTGEPFIIFYIPDQQVSSMISTDTEETDRAVAIYQNGGGGIKKTVVLEEIWVEDFFGQVTFGEGDVFGFIQEGVEYTVVWDGAEYTCVGTQYDSYLCLGNLGLYGGNWSSEPFILVTNPSTKESDLVMDDPGTYTLSVYRNEPVGGSGDSDSSDLVKYVTFKSCDGSEEYFKMPVLKGDDCKDPINHGDIETPTKPSTDKKEYTYNGWSLTANGLADSAALTNVTSDRVVYASFEESVRYYTVRFYTDPGVLYETVQVTYGGTAEPTQIPTKSGFSFDGWSPSNENITADTDCAALWIEAVTFANGSWADIAAISERGEAQNYFSVGDKRIIQYSDYEIELIIAGFEHDDLADGSGKAGMTIVTNTVASSNMQSSWGANNYWGNSDVKKTLQNTIKTYLPTELQAVIKSVSKQYDTNYDTTTHSKANSADELFLLSMTEMNIKGTGETGAYAILGAPYEGFVSGAIVPELCIHGTASPLQTYWLRQVQRNASAMAICKYYSGVSSVQAMGTNLKTSFYKLRFGFCI